MSEPSFSEFNQEADFRDSSVEGQVGQAGRDLIQIQGVTYLTINDTVDIAPLPKKQILDSAVALTRQEYRNRKVLLNKVKKFWVEDILEKSLHTKALLKVGLEERLDTISRPFNNVQELSEETPKSFPPGTGITQVFNQMGEGRTLLILGEPGAGKTTILLKLAQSLIARTEEDLSQPIPVVFNLSSWVRERQSIADWLVEELSNKYQVSKALGRVWVKEQQLLLLLDGLDEVNVEKREACVQAINQFVQAYGQTEIVICSRIRDYKFLSSRLQLQEAICIQSLTREQIDQYLAQAGEQLEAVKTLLQTDAVLQDLAKSPLMLSIMTLAYRGISVTELQTSMGLEERRKHLFDKYVDRMFRRRKTVHLYQNSQAQNWLIWLAKRMKDAQTIFFIEQIQPNWLESLSLKSVYLLTIFCLFGSVTGLIVGVFIGAFNNYKIGFYTGLISGLIAGILGIIFRRQVEPEYIFSFSYSRTLKYLPFGSFLGVVSGGLLALVFILYFYIILRYFPIEAYQRYLIGRGVSFGLLSGSIFSFIASFFGPKIEEVRSFPNQGIWRSLKTTLVLGGIGLIVVKFVVVLLKILFEIFNETELILYIGIPSYIPIWSQLVAGISFGLYGAGETCAKHFILRVFLFFTGYGPWNYARFLDYATDRILLQKVGGGYIFVHRLLLEHFAAMDTQHFQQKEDQA